MSNSDDGSASDEASVTSEQTPEPPHVNIIANPQTEDDEEDNRAFRGVWDRNAYDFVIGLIQQSGKRHNSYPYSGVQSFGSPYYSSRSQQTKDFMDIKGGEMELIDLSKMHSEYMRLTAPVCARIGRHIFMNEEIKYLHVSLFWLETAMVVGFFKHWIGEHSHLLGLQLEAPNMGDSHDDGGTGLSFVMKQFLCKNTTLKELHLPWLQMSAENGTDLAYILSDSPVPLVHLSLSRNELGDSAVEMLARSIGNMPTIRTLKLERAGISKYSAIAPVLRNKTCCLKKLDLGDNEIGDEFLADMAPDVTGNTTLEEIILSDNKQITDVGWKSVRDIVLNSSSLASIRASNHCLESVGRSWTRYRKPIPNMQSPMFCDLSNALRINEKNASELRTIRMKIRAGLFDPDKSFRSDLLEDFDAKLMPALLAVVGAPMSYFASNAHWRDAVYFILKHNRAVLAFPSPEKLRMLKMLKEKDAIIDGLKRELEQLKGGNMGSVGSKRPRT